MNKKTLLIITIIILSILTLCIIPLNMFVTNLPEWIMVIMALLLLSATVALLLVCEVGKATKIALSIYTVIFAAFALFCAYCNPFWNSLNFRSCPPSQDYDAVLTLKQAKQDMAYAYNYVKKDHPAFLKAAPKEFDSAYQNALKQLEASEQITVNDLFRELSIVLAVLGDGHTASWTNYSNDKYLKVIIERNANGWQLEKINGYTIEELFALRENLFSYEVDSWGIVTLKSYLSILSGMEFLGFDTSGIEYTWVNAQGTRETDVYTKDDFLSHDQYMEYNKAYFNQSNDRLPFVRYELDEKNDVAILTLDSCRYNEEYRSCLNEMFSKIKELGINNVAVDLRGNGGGSSRVADEFISYLDVDSFDTGSHKWRFGILMFPSFNDITKNVRKSDKLFTGNVYLLTDTYSFSSAMQFAEFIKDNGLGMIIGEAPGNTPNGYGEVITFKLPNSGLYFQSSTKIFTRANKDSTDLLVEPDIKCESNEAIDKLYEILKGSSANP